MEMIKSDKSEQKIIKTAVAVFAIMVGYILMVGFENIPQALSLDVELYVPKYDLVSKALSVLIAFGTFVFVMKNTKSYAFLESVYAELIKVVWPDSRLTSKHTIGIIIGVTIVGFLLGFFDFLARFLLNLAK